MTETPTTKAAMNSSQPNSPKSEKIQKGIVNAVVYAGNIKICDTTLEDAGQWAKQPGHIVWIGLYEPDEATFSQIQKQFNLHPLAIEDAKKKHQRTKVEQYSDSLFIVARTAERANRRITLHETHIFAGTGYVITIRHGASASYIPVRKRYEAVIHPFKNQEAFIIYSLLDFIVDNYMPMIEYVHKETETLENKVMLGVLQLAEIERLHNLRRDLLRLRSAVVPMVEVCRRLEHGDLLPIPNDIKELFRDVTDHTRRVQEEIEILRELLGFTFEANMMMGQIIQGDVTKKLAAWAAILAVPTAIAGIYGMNFKYIPETEWQYGYFMVLGVMLFVCTTLYVAFKRSNWL